MIFAEFQMAEVVEGEARPMGLACFAVGDVIGYLQSNSTCTKIVFRNGHSLLIYLPFKAARDFFVAAGLGPIAKAEDVECLNISPPPSRIQ